MNYRTLATVVFAGCCVFAVASMAVSLETTVPGEPEDVLDVDTASLPLPTEDTDQIKTALQSGPESGEGQDSGVREADSGDQRAPQARLDGAEQAAREVPEGDDGRAASQPEPQAAGGDGGGSADSRAAGGAAAQAAQGASGGEDGQSGQTGQSASQRLPLLGLLLALAVAALLYRYHDRLRARLGRWFGDDEGTAGEDATVFARPPENEIERQWLELLARADAPEEPTATPRERANAVVQAGLPAEPVHELTALYESVRYGERPVTDSAVAEATAYVRQTTEGRDE